MVLLRYFTLYCRWETLFSRAEVRGVTIGVRLKYDWTFKRIHLLFWFHLVLNRDLLISFSRLCGLVEGTTLQDTDCHLKAIGVSQDCRFECLRKKDWRTGGDLRAWMLAFLLMDMHFLRHKLFGGPLHRILQLRRLFLYLELGLIRQRGRRDLFFEPASARSCPQSVC